MPPRLLFDPVPWMANREKCPCDWEALEWLEQHPQENRIVFHMGTGLHHLIGRTEAHRPGGAYVIGLTCTPLEYLGYIDEVIEDPVLGNGYHCLFGDIYTFEPQFFLPEVDVVTLFHLGEFTNDLRAAYGGVGDRSVIERFLFQPSNRERVLMFYTGSNGYERIRPIIDEVLRDGVAREDPPYGSLRIIRR